MASHQMCECRTYKKAYNPLAPFAKCKKEAKYHITHPTFREDMHVCAVHVKKYMGPGDRWEVFAAPETTAKLKQDWLERQRDRPDRWKQEQALEALRAKEKADRAKATANAPLQAKLDAIKALCEKRGEMMVDFYGADGFHLSILDIINKETP